MMHISADTKYVSYNCDICSEEFDPYQTDMNIVLNKAKEEGWKIQNTNNETSHYCPRCVEDPNWSSNV